MYWKRAEVNFTNSATFLYLGHDENTILKQEKSSLKVVQQLQANTILK